MCARRLEMVVRYSNGSLLGKEVILNVKGLWRSRILLRLLFLHGQLLQRMILESIYFDIDL